MLSVLTDLNLQTSIVVRQTTPENIMKGEFASINSYCPSLSTIFSCLFIFCVD